MKYLHLNMKCLHLVLFLSILLALDVVILPLKGNKTSSQFPAVIKSQELVHSTSIHVHVEPSWPSNSLLFEASAYFYQKDIRLYVRFVQFLSLELRIHQQASEDGDGETHALDTDVRRSL